MTRAARSLRWFILAGTALAGLIGAHLLDYVLVIPNHATRHDVLAATGHGYLGIAVGLAVSAAILAGVSSVALGFRHASRGSAAPLAFGQVARRLVLLQSAGFLALELAERVSAGVPAHHFFDSPVIALGAILQVVVALIGAATLVFLARGGELIGRALSARTAFARASFRFEPPLHVVPLARHRSRPGPIRAPPILLEAIP